MSSYRPTRCASFGQLEPDLQNSLLMRQNGMIEPTGAALCRRHLIRGARIKQDFEMAQES